MPRSRASPGVRLLGLWRFLSGVPGGRWVFSRLVGRLAPYSGTVGARVLTLEAGRCVADLVDRRRLRNHLDSVHAVALVNLGELVTGLATLTALPPGARGIVVALEARYGKKARGRLRAECRTEVGPIDAPVEHRARAEIRDAAEDVVATVEAVWRLAPAVRR